MLKSILIRSSSIKSLDLTQTSRGHLDSNLYFWGIDLLMDRKMNLDVATKLFKEADGQPAL